MHARNVVTATVVATAAWCSAATLDVTTVDRFRVAMFPPWWTLAAAIALCVAGFGIAGVRHVATPTLLASALLVLPYLPSVPDALPVLRALAGPGRWLLWLIIVALAVWPASARFGGIFRLKAEATKSQPEATKPQRFLSWLPASGGSCRAVLPAVFLASALVIGGAAVRLAGTPLFPRGDEPHYLVITQSLLKDGDLKIENNHEQQDYAAYFHAPLRPHYLARGRDRQIYSVHPVGVSFLVLPAFAIAGYPGVVLFLILLSAGVATMVWWRAFELTQSRSAATFGWIATCLTAPFLFNAFAVYPETSAAACVVLAFPWTRTATSRTWLTRGLSMAALPWFSSKYVAMAGVLVLIALWHVRHQKHAAGLVCLPFALSLAGWFSFFYAIWGSPSPAAAYGGNTSTRISTLLAGGPGLWLDQEYGLLPYAPVLLFVFPGLVAMWRAGGRGGDCRRVAIEIGLVFAALLAVVGSFHIWWGGSASPGRPVIAAVPLLAIPIAWQFRTTRDDKCRAGQLLLLFVSLALSGALLFAQEGLLLANNRNGSARFLEWLSVAGELPPLFPSFIVDPPIVGMAKASVWIAALVGAAWSLAQLKPGANTNPMAGTALRVMMIAVAAVLCSSTVIAIAFGNSHLTTFARAASADKSALKKAEAALRPGDFRLKAEATKRDRTRSAMLDSFDRSRRPIGIAYDPFRRIDTNEIPELFPLVATRDPWSTRFVLPSGVYRAFLRPTDETTPRAAAAIALTVGPDRVPIMTWSLAQILPYPILFEVPVDFRFAGFRLIPDEGLSHLTMLRIVPSWIVDASHRPTRLPVVSAAPYADAVVFFHDVNTFPEPAGIWTKGGRSADLTIYPQRHDQRMRLRIHTGPISNPLRLRSIDWEERFDLAPGHIQEVEIPRRGDSPVIPLHIDATTGFVPAELDRRSTDRRFLGCWIEFAGT